MTYSIIDAPRLYELCLVHRQWVRRSVLFFSEARNRETAFNLRLRASMISALGIASLALLAIILVIHKVHKNID